MMRERNSCVYTTILQDSEITNKITYDLQEYLRIHGNTSNTNRLVKIRPNIVKYHGEGFPDACHQSQTNPTYSAHSTSSRPYHVTITISLNAYIYSCLIS